MIEVNGETYEDADDYMNVQMSRIYGFKKALAELINKFGMDAATRISDVALADYLYGQMVHLSQTIPIVEKERNV